MINSILIAISVALTPAIAEPRATPEPSPTAVPAKAEAKRYCIVDTLIGSRVPKRICHSRSEWLERGVDPLAAK